MDDQQEQLYQFAGGGPAILVKNTFLDIDDVPKPVELQRARTAPPLGQDARDAGEEDGEASASDDDGETGVPEAPSPERLDRMVTREWYETPNLWSWGGGGMDVGQMPPLPEIGTHGQQMSAPSMQLGMQPVMQTAPMPGTGMAGGITVSAGQMPPAMMYQMPPGTMMGPGGMPMVPVAIPIGMFPQMPEHMSGIMNEPFMQQQVVTSPNRGARWPAQPQPGDVPLDSTSQNEPQPPFALGTASGASSTALQAGAPNNDVVAPVADAGGEAPPPPPQPQTLTRAFSISSGFFRVHWTVDARKLRGNDKQAVSPPFELSFGAAFNHVTFKMMIYPKVMNDNKGGASFKKAKGRGYIQLKCEAELSEAVAQVRFRLSIGGSAGKSEEPRGPMLHNFAQSAVCGLPKEMEEWDFNSVVDNDSMTFVVCLEIVPGRT